MIDLWGNARFVVVVAIVVCLLNFGVPCGFSVSSQDATSAIANAEHMLQMAFVNVSDAENRGANVSTLLGQLSVAGADLTLAETAINAQNYTEAVSQATESEMLTESVARSAVGMKNAGTGWFTSFLSVFAVALVASTVIVAFLVLGWLWFKRYYGQKLSRLRPEVAA